MGDFQQSFFKYYFGVSHEVYLTYITRSWLPPINMTDGEISVSVKKAIRGELRRYKTEDGLTHDVAITRLLECTDWIDYKTEFIEKIIE